MRIIALALGIGLAFAALPARAGAPQGNLAEKAPLPLATLRQFVTVDDTHVRLGDLFEGAGAYADRQVVQAPAPGKRTSLDAVWLYKLARAYGLEWRPIGKNDRAVVERASVTVSDEEIRSAIRAALGEKGVSEDAEMSLGQRELRMHVPANTDPTVTIEDVVLDRTSQRFSCVAVVAAGSADSVRTRISGQVHPTTEVPVLSRGAKKGDILTASDIQWTRIRANDVGRDTVTDIDHIIGLTPVRFLREGVPLRIGDIQPPVLVAKGSLVTMMLKTPTMTLTVQGRALEDGVKGAAIQVENTISKHPVLATVASGDVVIVRTTASVASLY